MAKKKKDPPATTTDIENVQALLERLSAEMVSLRDRLPPLQSKPPRAPPQVAAADASDQMVTLNQIAAIVHRSKRSLEYYRKKMPAPRIPGHKGKPNLWLWAEVRPWLESVFGFNLPERFPG